ncbi:MAG: ABC transporter permease [Fervidobacterium sp.]|uniref:ABC-type dipeptide/oligopeptide/nickel transport system, permease component n=1 Tax=Fervidobacterium gondwanense DSM 13020 TaxID=1121883 RepID=A0A1M7T992_FERGO|nr:ABC transporter permease [Fervidobacterium gondwanense]UXF01308.1 ABC transporter permease [Fervidobacterium riparium]SHN67267.1 ABC-type dipeptide/oligopeptide/nickel transport system, permease component [Fervidobacterium gondwanense DSM 13020]
MSGLELFIFAVLIPAVGVYFSLWKGKKPKNYIFLAISILLYYGALFNIKYLYLFSPRFNFIIAPIVYFYAFDLPGLAKFIRNRVAQIVLLLVIYVTLVFFIFLAMPGDYTTKFLDPKIMRNPEMYERIKKMFGVDDPWYVKYYKHMKNFFNLEMGISFSEYPKKVEEIIAERLPRTLFLFLASSVLSFLLGFDLGKRIAWKRGGLVDKAATFVGIVFWTIFTPFYMLIIIWLFGVTLKWFPLSGFITPSKWFDAPFSAQDVFLKLLWTELFLLVMWILGVAVASKLKTIKAKKTAIWSFVALGIVLAILYWATNKMGTYALDIVYHLALPVIALVTLHFAGDMLVMRDTMLEVIKEDYITTARAKGLPDKVIRDKHAARTALLPLMTSFVIGLASTVSGGVITETMFSWKGMGLTLLEATTSQDTPLAIGCLVFTGVLVLFAHLVADILYAFLDPRIRY